VWALTTEEFLSLLKESKSIACALARMGISTAGSNYRVFLQRMSEEGLSKNDFFEPPIKRQIEALRSSAVQRRRPIEEICTEDSRIQRNVIRARIVREELLPYECAICRMGPVWQGVRLEMHLDHVNGKPRDHRLVNLRFLCPNCHSQTPTFGGRNAKR
jgi:hypothetical protein